MPSGSHGESSGSHGSGNSNGSFGGGGFGGFGSNSTRKIEPKYVKIFGAVHYISVLRQTAISILSTFLAFIVFITIPTALNFVSLLTDKATLNSDYNRYQKMITYAQENPSYIVDASFYKKEYEEEYKSWKIYYKFKTSDSKTVEGFSYYVYSEEEANEFHYGSQIKIAVDSVPVSLKTDSVPLQFKNISLENMKEWEEVCLEEEKGKEAILPLGIMIAIIAVLLLFITVTSPIKESAFSSKDYDNQKVYSRDEILEQTQIDNDLNTNYSSIDNTNEYRQSDGIETITCKYCGSVMGEGNVKCPFCGATVKNKKK